MTQEMLAKLCGNDTAEFGYEWRTGDVSNGSGNDKQLLGPAPYVYATDVEKFNATFPGIALDSINGTSVKVKCQDATRTLLEKNIRATVAELRRAVINRLRGVKMRSVSVVEKRIYCATDGTEFTDKQEMLDYQAALNEEASDEADDAAEDAAAEVPITE